MSLIDDGTTLSNKGEGPCKRCLGGCSTHWKHTEYDLGSGLFAAFGFLSILDQGVRVVGSRTTDDEEMEGWYAKTAKGTPARQRKAQNVSTWHRDGETLGSRLGGSKAGSVCCNERTIGSRYKERHFPIMDAPDQSVGDRGGEDQSHAEPREGARPQANIFVMCGCVWS